MSPKPHSFRFSSETLKKIDELSFATKLNKTKLLEQLVNEAYDKMQGNPKLKEALSDLQKINDMLSELDYKLKS